MANHENEDYLIKLFLDKVSKLQSNWCLWEWNPLNIDIEKLEDVNTLMRDVIGLYNELDGNLALQSDFTRIKVVYTRLVRQYKEWTDTIREINDAKLMELTTLNTMISSVRLVLPVS